jgi:drug/metabolite transporter superfamily protein YnfA
MDLKQIYIALPVLFAAAVLEAGGDALVRFGLRSHATTPKTVLYLIGAVVLFSYGYVVNAPSWDFGRLLGIYVVFFFVVAQLISWLAFRQPPTSPVLIGGAFIVAGGFIISLWS